MRFVIYGAGAVGGVLGGQLALHKHDVLLVCREAHAEAIGAQRGLRMKSATGEYFAHLDAVSSATPDRLDKAACVFLTCKSGDTETCARELSGRLVAATPVVSFQNGVSNERVLSQFFGDVYGGICRMTCSCLQPGQVSFRKLGRLIIGRYPDGAHPFAKKLGRTLSAAGFDVSVSKSIMNDKWLKLTVNLQSALNAIIDDRDQDSLELVELKLGVLDEAKRVLGAAGIRAQPCDGRDQTIDAIMTELRKPRIARAPSAVNVHNSTWQNLYLARPAIENAYFHGPIIELGRAHGIPVFFNEVTLDLVNRCGESALGPGAMRAADVLADVHKRSAGN